ncbi:Nyctalopin like protein [Argiope bruennichi]|uniref:Nyctalopin like protein n=1 Tax=Argiope bruennichi TaxID=94029 RepID=A0A8T0EC21_ARGBR|nr:Nyctalopin like protein [Argiope bruennichi]
MWFSLILLSFSTIITTSIGFSNSSDKAHCPPPEEVKPCTCSDSGEVSALCTGIHDESAIINVFSKHSNWNIHAVHFDRCILDYIPSAIVNYGNIEKLNVSSSTLSSLFDEPPTKTPKITIYLYDVKFSRGIEWELLANSSISGLGTFNVDIRHFGKDFKEYMPEVVKHLWFEDSKTVRITHQAFQRMINLEILTLTGGSLKHISRDMFPRPWNIKFLNLSRQKFTSLPKDLFEDLPELTMFSIMKNHLTTIDVDIFTKSGASYFLHDNPIYCNCDIKWITTSGKESSKVFFGKCADPDSFKGKSLNTLTEEDFNFCQ